MSGEDLRKACIHNRIDELRDHLTLKANPCSADQYGLTALHYACWNGHIECVKFLIMNPYGVDVHSQRNSCINMKSELGYTPLHLLALEAPLSILKDILILLLLVGADPKIIDNEQQTAIQLAKTQKNQVFIDAFYEFIDMKKNEKYRLKTMLSELKKKYRLPDLSKTRVIDREGKNDHPLLTGKPGTMSINASFSSFASVNASTIASFSSVANQEIEDDDIRSIQEEEAAETAAIAAANAPTIITEAMAINLKAKGKLQTHPVEHLPKGVTHMLRDTIEATKVIRPKELLIHENVIPSLARISYHELKGIHSLKVLNFARDQALKNVDRRERLVQKDDYTLPKLDLKKL
jgi:hypothetical protein